jgi:ankyrin repeat protein
MDTEYMVYDNNDELSIITDELSIINEVCNKHNEEYTKICECDCMYCDKCERACKGDSLHILYSIDDWKNQILLQMKKCVSGKNIKIKGLNFICEIINNDQNECNSFIKQIEDIMDTIFVDISHIDNFNKLINDNNIPISHIIKRKNTILNSKFVTIDKKDIRGHQMINIINLILKNGADIHGNDEEVLTYASRHGGLAVVELLIKYDANIHAQNDLALGNASIDGQLAVVECLIKNGADRATPNLGVAADIHALGDYALRMASCYGHLDVVKCLIEHGADIHIDNDKALRWASCNGHLAVVECLISHGANVTADNDRALLHASCNGHQDVVKCLIKNGAAEVLAPCEDKHRRCGSW